MKKQKIISLNNLYLLALFYFFYCFIDEKKFFSVELTSNINNLFGIGKYFLFIILLANYFVEFIEDVKTKNRSLIITFLMFLSYLAGVVMWLSYRLGVMFGNPMKNLEDTFTRYSFFKCNFGLIPTYLSSHIVLNPDKRILYSGIGVSLIIIVVTVIVVINHFIIKLYKSVKDSYNKLRNIEEIDNDILEKIEIKEAIEKRDIEQKLKVKREEERRKDLTIRKSIKELEEEINKRKNATWLFDIVEQEPEEDEKEEK